MLVLMPCNNIRVAGAERLAGGLGQCSSLAELNLKNNCIGYWSPSQEGARRLAGVLGQCSSLQKLNLESNGIDSGGIAMLRACWPGASGLSMTQQL